MSKTILGIVAKLIGRAALCQYRIFQSASRPVKHLNICLMDWHNAVHTHSLSHMMYPNDFGDPLTFSLVAPGG